jgi:hypothetical protein
MCLFRMDKTGCNPYVFDIFSNLLNINVERLIKVVLCQPDAFEVCLLAPINETYLFLNPERFGKSNRRMNNPPGCGRSQDNILGNMRIPTSLQGGIVIGVMNKAVPPHTITSEGRFPRTNQHFFAPDDACS